MPAEPEELLIRLANLTGRRLSIDRYASEDRLSPGCLKYDRLMNQLGINLVY